MFEKKKVTKEEAAAALDAQKPLTENEAAAGKEIMKAPPVDLDTIMPEDLENDDVFDSIISQVEAKSKAGTLTEVTAGYLNFDDWKENEERPFVFLRMTTFTNPETGEVQDAVMLVDKERGSWITGSAILVQALRKVEKIPCGVMIKKYAKIAGKRYHNVRVWAL